RAGVSTEESVELKRLRRENAELKRANAILKAASSFFAAELDRPQRCQWWDRGVHPRTPGSPGRTRRPAMGCGADLQSAVRARSAGCPVDLLRPPRQATHRTATA